MYKVCRILIIRRIHASSSSEESELDTHTSGGGSSSEESTSGGAGTCTASTHTPHHPRTNCPPAMTHLRMNCSLRQDDTIGQTRMNSSLPSLQARMPFSMIR